MFQTKFAVILQLLKTIRRMAKDYILSPHISLIHFYKYSMEGKRDFFSNMFSRKLEYLHMAPGLDYVVILAGFPAANDACDSAR